MPRTAKQSQTTTAKKPTRKRYVLLVNAKSRRGLKHFEQAERYLAAHSSVELVMAKAVRRPTELQQELDRVLKAEPDVLVLGGGDGTVSAVIHALVHTPIKLAVLPLGTTNNFCRTLDIPLDFPAALKNCTDGRPAKADAAFDGTDYFVNVASLGLSTRIAHSVSHRGKKWFGRLAYGVAGIRELLTHRNVHCQITANGKTYRFRTHQLIIANGRYHSAIEFSPDASVRDGQLNVFSMDGGNRRTLIKNFVRYNLGGIDKLRGHTVITASEIRLTTKPRRRLEVDGELALRTPVTISCVPDALHVLVPADHA